MGAADPTYPLYPIAAIIAAVLLLLVLLSSFVRQSWNLGVAFLCFWLFFENLTAAINAILWSDNDDVKLYIYCDIVSHIQLIAYVVKPISSLLIMRRLYLIASLRSVALPSNTARRWDRCIEWTLGLIFPMLVAGPIYYSVQEKRFNVIEGYGCCNAPATSIVKLLAVDSYSIVTPFLSTILYYPRVANIMYRQSREFNGFLLSNQSISRPYYFRVLILATFNTFVMLSLNVAVFVSEVLSTLDPTGSIPFYPGWSSIHSKWSPSEYSKADLEAGSTMFTACFRLSRWVSVVIPFVIFALFGLTPVGARASYWRVLCTVTGWFGRKPTWRGRSGATRSVLSSIRFNRNAPSQEISLASCELGRLPSVIGIAPPPLVDADLEGQKLSEDVAPALDESKSSMRRCSDRAEDAEREPDEPDAETIDIGKVSLSGYGSTMTV